MCAVLICEHWAVYGNTECRPLGPGCDVWCVSAWVMTCEVGRGSIESVVARGWLLVVAVGSTWWAEGAYYSDVVSVCGCGATTVVLYSGRRETSNSRPVICVLSLTSHCVLAREVPELSSSDVCMCSGAEVSCVELVVACKSAC